jgi:hypothetical protein
MRPEHRLDLVELVTVEDVAPAAAFAELETAGGEYQNAIACKSAVVAAVATAAVVVEKVTTAQGTQRKGQVEKEQKEKWREEGKRRGRAVVAAEVAGVAVAFDTAE